MKEIVQEGASILRETAVSMPEDMFGSPELKKLITEMSEALDAQPEGVALAAPQVGVPLRLFIVRTDRTLPVPHEPKDVTAGRDTKARTDIYINPDIIKTSRRRVRTDEGCLSVRDIYGTTLRHERVTIRARLADGSAFTRGAGGLLAQIFEHEVDHLNGILFTDHAENLVRITHEATQK